MWLDAGVTAAVSNSLFCGLASEIEHSLPKRRRQIKDPKQDFCREPVR
jgi:hypothetical protein